MVSYSKYGYSNKYSARSSACFAESDGGILKEATYHAQ